MRRNQVEGLRGYLFGSDSPTTFESPHTNPRHPVGPAGAIPPGRRPLPSSSETNKKTNAAIPVAREPVQTYGADGVSATLSEGEIAFVECTRTGGKRLPNEYAPTSLHRIHSISHVNELFQSPERFWDAAGPAPTHETLGFALDGVVNNTDGEDKEREFRTKPISNVVVQGPVRFLKTQVGNHKRIRDTLYVGAFWKDAPIGGKRMLVFRAFSGGEVGAMEKAGDLASLTLLWKLGSILDTAQSPAHLTVLVNVSIVHAPTTDEYRAVLRHANVQPDVSTGLLNGASHAFSAADDGIYEIAMDTFVEWSFRRAFGAPDREMPIELVSLTDTLKSLHVV